MLTRYKSLHLVLLLGAFPAIAFGQGPADARSRIQEANRLLGEQKPAEAAALLAEVVDSDAEQPQAWMLLGQARRQTGDLDGALAALQRAAGFAPTEAAAFRALFLLYLERQDLSSANDAYRRLRSTPGVDLSGLHLQPKVSALREDSRFAPLFPTGFADPFVEGKAVIHDWHGEKAGQAFGWEARNAGDVDGDGVDDAVVSAPANQPNADASGALYLYSGRSGELLWKRAGEPGDRLGSGIEAAGDVNGDEIPDVVASAPGAGKVYVLGGRSGEVLHTFDKEEEDGNSFGTQVSGAGDVDGDGHDDLLVGVASANQGAGRAYLFSGKNGKVLRRFEGEPGENLGSVVAGATQEGITYVVLGAPGADEGGRVYVHRGSRETGLGDEPAFTIEGEPSARQLGAMFASVVGDVDADGVSDVYASDWADATHGPFTGRIYVHSGKDGRRLLTLAGEAAGDGFGIGPARAGDVDRDGHDDLVVGAWQHRSAAHSGGKVYVYSGKDGTLLRAYTGRIPGETLGFDADGMGDVDGDGDIDFLVTSAYSLIEGVRSGRTLVISGAIDRQPPAADG